MKHNSNKNIEGMDVTVSEHSEACPQIEYQASGFNQPELKDPKYNESPQ